MIYNAYSVTLKPGRRFDAIAHMKKLVAHLKDAYGVSTQILGNVGGPVYRHHMVMQFDSLAQMEEVSQQLLADEMYGEWFQGTEGLVDWAGAEQFVYQVFD